MNDKKDTRVLQEGEALDVDQQCRTKNHGAFPGNPLSPLPV